MKLSQSQSRWRWQVKQSLSQNIYRAK